MLRRYAMWKYNHNPKILIKKFNHRTPKTETGGGVQGQKADVIVEYVFTRYSCMKIVHMLS